MLRKKKEHPSDNGVWFATSEAYHRELSKLMPSIRSIKILGKGKTNWQIIPESGTGFESDVLSLCELVRKGDKRIGHIPSKKKNREANSERFIHL
ncbi:MAG: hypothetical protein ACHQQQ_14520 [Bacteroidota bacterium]